MFFRRRAVNVLQIEKPLLRSAVPAHQRVNKRMRIDGLMDDRSGKSAPQLPLTRRVCALRAAVDVGHMNPDSRREISKRRPSSATSLRDFCRVCCDRDPCQEHEQRSWPTITRRDSVAIKMCARH